MKQYEADAQKVFIVAELSANHHGSLDIALETIRVARQCGADAIKLQTYTPDTITLNSARDDFKIKGTIWEGKNLYELYQEAFTPWEWHKVLFEEAEKEGLVCFSSPFDFTAVDFLEQLGCPIYKIASFEITDVNLIEYTASKDKPMIMSTGIAAEKDIELAIKACHAAGNYDITLLKCTSSYPAPIEEANLSTIELFAKKFGTKVGLSDHTLGIEAPVVATCFGATVIEKHFILDKLIGGPDASFSLNPAEFKAMVDAIRRTEILIGKKTLKPSKKQIQGRQFSRSIYVSAPIKKGEIFSNINLRSVRPGFGLHPKYLKEVLGKKAIQDLEIGQRMELAFVDGA